jgi:hypothetical protein
MVCVGMNRHLRAFARRVVCIASSYVRARNSASLFVHARDGAFRNHAETRIRDGMLRMNAHQAMLPLLTLGAGWWQVDHCGGG